MTNQSLREFYQSPTGRRAAQDIQNALKALWPNAQTTALLGLGFCAPYLKPEDFALLPPRLAPLRRPDKALSRSLVWGGGALPLESACAKGALLIHLLEHERSPAALLREVWRVLEPEGRILAVFPRRFGWAIAQTPFADGRRFSQNSAETLLRAALFEPLDARNALFLPDTIRRRFPHAENFASRYAARRLLPPLGGLVILLAQKKIEARITPSQARPAWRALKAR